MQVLALKHHTSKLADFPDLQSLATFGFRGEALSSLCALGNLTVETKTKNESVATHLTFDHSGLLVAERKTARQIGTTVTVKKLFSNLPVRSKEFSRNIRKEYGKLISLLNVSIFPVTKLNDILSGALIQWKFFLPLIETGQSTLNSSSPPPPTPTKKKNPVCPFL